MTSFRYTSPLLACQRKKLGKNPQAAILSLLKLACLPVYTLIRILPNIPKKDGGNLIMGQLLSYGTMWNSKGS